MKIPKAQRVLRTRLAYLNAKLSVSWSPPVQRERDALDLALRMLKWRDDEDVEIAVESSRQVERVLPAERRMRARAAKGDELLGRVQAFVVALQRAGRAA